MHPSKKERIIIDPKLLEEPTIEAKPTNPTPAERLEHSVILNALIGILGWSYIVMYFVKGGSLNLNIINFIFFFAAIVLLAHLVTSLTQLKILSRRLDLF